MDRDTASIASSAIYPGKSHAVFFAQIIASVTVIIAAIYNLSTSDHNTTLWSSLLSANIGYLLPNPSIKRNVEWRSHAHQPSSS